MFVVLAGLCLGLSALGGAYLFGVHVGLSAGRRAGRLVADAEWAQWAEHGAL